MYSSSGTSNRSNQVSNFVRRRRKIPLNPYYIHSSGLSLTRLSSDNFLFLLEKPTRDDLVPPFLFWQNPRPCKRCLWCWLREDGNCLFTCPEPQSAYWVFENCFEDEFNANSCSVLAELQSQSELTPVGKAMASEVQLRLMGKGSAHVQNKLRQFHSDQIPVITLFRDHAAWCPYCQKTVRRNISIDYMCCMDL